ncbi:hypothetical protein [Pseudoclavibacter sp. VKM Ac-2867]|uniref:hypothetical protein n=1 Tax=Pseudoclavibacter sp. VKM Ac-2867 TaxID=2783829 RepID=UPI00188D54DC|nr:hypothetical protein [Pseudoclavibacter sp. VKM Ac-2867]MBF4459393.1 hypothetical protein [Pseudoclavibacter sp. VKM Ac-2867]
MSLTEHLKDLRSPLRIYLEHVAPELGEVEEFEAVERLRADAWGLTRLLETRTVSPKLPQVDGPRAGTAIDLRMRMALGDFDLLRSTALAGAAALPGLAPAVTNGQHRAAVLQGSFEVAERLLSAPSDEEDLDLAALLLAQCEQIYRGGTGVLAGSIGKACDQVQDGEELAARLDPLAIADIRSMMLANEQPLARWQQVIADGGKYVPGPNFAGARLVGGADGDWIVNGTLYDCKAYSTLRSSDLREFLLQLLAYVLLDLDDEHRIREVGLWLPRQAMTQTWPVARLIDGDPEVLLPELRRGLAEAVRRDRSERDYDKPSEARLKIVVAENPLTRPAPLDYLADDDSERVRRRIARNTSTDPITLRRLSADRHWTVREGVALNPETASDIIAVLREDRSRLVREAAERHPRAPRVQIEKRPRGVMSSTREASQGVAVPETVVAESALDTRRTLAELAELQLRRPEMGPSHWVHQVLWLLTSPNASVFEGGLLPIETMRWEWKRGRANRVPEWLQRGVPQEVLDEFFSPEQPSWLRRIAARWKSVEDHKECLALFGDPDPGVRVDALKRSRPHDHAALHPILEDLVASYDARLLFGGREAAADVLELAISHAATPVEALMELAEGATRARRQQLAVHPRLSDDFRTELGRKLLTSRRRDDRVFFAESPHTPEPILRDLAAVASSEVRTALACNPSAPATVLDALSGSTDAFLKLACLENANLPLVRGVEVAEELLSLRLHELSFQVLVLLQRRPELSPHRAIVAAALNVVSKRQSSDADGPWLASEHPCTSEETLTRLARHSREDVRAQVAKHPQTPVDIVETLGKDSQEVVRASAAASGRNSLVSLHRLAQDPHWAVRAATASDTRLSDDALRALTRDDHYAVRLAATRNPATPETPPASDSNELETAPGVGSRELEGPDQQRRLIALAASPKAQDRQEAGYDDEASLGILTALAGDPRSYKVRCVAAGNPNMSMALLRLLAEDDRQEVRQAVALNPAASTDVLLGLASQDADFALLVVFNPDVPTDVLDVLAADHDKLIRFVAGEALRARRP